MKLTFLFLAFIFDDFWKGKNSLHLLKDINYKIEHITIYTCLKLS